MSKMGFRTFQEMVGRTDKLRFAPNPDNPKAATLNFDRILKNALDIRPNTNIVGGSVQQTFDTTPRIVSL
jgi:glutamate synthase (NADPH/NADH)